MGIDFRGVIENDIKYRYLNEFFKVFFINMTKSLSGQYKSNRSSFKLNTFGAYSVEAEINIITLLRIWFMRQAAQELGG